MNVLLIFITGAPCVLGGELFQASKRTKDANTARVCAHVGTPAPVRQVRSDHRDGDEERVNKLILALAQQDPKVRKAAVLALGNIGPGAKKAIPELIKVLRAPSSYPGRACEYQPGILYLDCLGARAAVALIQIGSDSARPLAETATDTRYSKNSRLSAVIALHKLGPKAKTVTGMIARLLTDDDEEIKLNALWVLVRAAPGSMDVKRHVLGVFADESAYVRVNAALALYELDPGNVISLPILLDCLSRNTSRVQLSAAQALGKLGPSARTSVPQIARLLASPDRMLRSAAAHAIGEIGTSAPDVINLLQKLCDDQDSDVRENDRYAIDLIRRRMGR